MTPERRKLLNECLAPGESELYHSTVLAFTGTKEDIEWLKSFRNGELKKRTAYQRRNLIEDARMQIEKWETKAKRDAETPVTCPKCNTHGFLPAGLKSHLKNCNGEKRAALAKPATKKAKAIDGKAELVKQDDLPSLSAGLAFVQAEIDEIGRKAMQQALPLKLKQGLFCLKAQSLYAIEDPAKRGAMGGRPKTSSDSDQVSDEPSDTPGSFSDWISLQPLTKGSAYDYMRAVEGLGLDHQADEKQLVKAYEAARKKAGEDLSITKLKNLLEKPEESEEPKEDPNTPEAKAAEAREQAAAWITTWDRSVKAGNLEFADMATLKQLDEFLTNTREHIRKRLKSSKA
jgi:hypothetical protein